MEHLPITALTVTACVQVGMLMALLGSVKMALARRPDQADVQVRNLLTILNVLLVPAFVVSGIFVDQSGVRPAMITGSILLSLSFLALSARLTYHRTIVAVLAATFGASALHVATIVQLPMGLFGLSEVAASLLMGLVFVSLGGLISPVLMDVLVHSIGFRRSMATLALFFLAPALLSAFPSAEAFPATSNLDALDSVDRRVIFAGLVFFAYAPLEAFISVWTSSYLANLGQSNRQTIWLSCFWGSMVVSRLAFAALWHLVDFRNEYVALTLVLLSMLAAVLLGNLSGSTKTEMALFGLIGLGFVLGPIFPMLLGLLFTELRDTRVFGMAYAMLFTFGSLGTLILSPLVRVSASKANLQAALRIPLFISLALFLLTLTFALLPRPGN